MNENPCPVCGEETTHAVTVLGRELTVHNRCRCEREKAEQEQADFDKMQADIQFRNLRRSCFLDSSYAKHTFDADDKSNAELSQAMRHYVDGWEQMRAENLGLLLHGPVGSGKTFYAAAIANALMQNGVRCLMTNFATVIMKLQGMYAGRAEYLESIAKVPLLILDDLGAERQSEFMLEQVYTIVDARYRIQRPLIVTTNLDIGEIKYPKDLTYHRIYDRILSMCHPVKVGGPSRRREALKAQYAQRNALLGLSQ